LSAKELGTNTVSSSGRESGSPIAIAGGGGWTGGGGGGGVGGGGGGGGGVGGGGGFCLAGGPRRGSSRQKRCRCPDRRQRKHLTGSRQEAAQWSRAKQLKQRPEVARMKSSSAVLGGRLNSPLPGCHELSERRRSLPSHRRDECLLRLEVVDHPWSDGSEEATEGRGAPWRRTQMLRFLESSPE
jgi:hypothetical protein